jgi:23S rRNA (adenine2503-C2)-methyltransferase
MIPAEDPSGGRRTACISSQVGCPVGCRFCASGLGGLDGNLSTGRIVEQVWRLSRLLAEEGGQGDEIGRITNVVFMGMGEPLANIANVIRAVRIICSLPDKGNAGMGISARKVTISTVGLPKAIERLAEELELPVTLALSLHAPNDELRRTLIPWAEYTTIPDLLAACQKWFNKTGREITLEYIMLGGVNDQPEHARELAGVARSLRANVNLIRYNEVEGLPFARPRDADVRAFQEILRERHVNAHIRASRGRDIAAACGQLRHEAAGASGVIP